MLLYEIIDAFEAAKLKYAIVGGYALALHGLVRATMDVDLVLSLKLADFELAEATLGKATLSLGPLWTIGIRPGKQIFLLRKI